MEKLAGIPVETSLFCLKIETELFYAFFVLLVFVTFSLGIKSDDNLCLLFTFAICNWKVIWKLLVDNIF